MGSLPLDTRCGWCGRVGASYIPDGIDPPVPLCSSGGRTGWGCLYDDRTREDVILLGLMGVCALKPNALQRWRMKMWIALLLAPVCPAADVRRRIARSVIGITSSNAPLALLHNLVRIAQFL